MTRMLQVRNLSLTVHSELVRRAKRDGVSLSDYVRQILERETERMPLNEWLEWTRSRGPIDFGGGSAADLVNEAREERAQYFDEGFRERHEEDD